MCWLHREGPGILGGCPLSEVLYWLHREANTLGTRRGCPFLKLEGGWFHCIYGSRSIFANHFPTEILDGDNVEGRE